MTTHNNDANDNATMTSDNETGEMTMTSNNNAGTIVYAVGGTYDDVSDVGVYFHAFYSSLDLARQHRYNRYSRFGPTVATNMNNASVVDYASFRDNGSMTRDDNDERVSFDDMYIFVIRVDDTPNDAPDAPDPNAGVFCKDCGVRMTDYDRKLFGVRCENCYGVEYARLNPTIAAANDQTRVDALAYCASVVDSNAGARCQDCSTPILESDRHVGFLTHCRNCAPLYASTDCDFCGNERENSASSIAGVCCNCRDRFNASTCGRCGRHMPENVTRNDLCDTCINAPDDDDAPASFANAVVDLALSVVSDDTRSLLVAGNCDNCGCTLFTNDDYSLYDDANVKLCARCDENRAIVCSCDGCGWQILEYEYLYNTRSFGVLCDTCNTRQVNERNERNERDNIVCTCRYNALACRACWDDAPASTSASNATSANRVAGTLAYIPTRIMYDGDGSPWPMTVGTVYTTLDLARQHNEHCNDAPVIFHSAIDATVYDGASLPDWLIVVYDLATSATNERQHG